MTPGGRRSERGSALVFVLWIALIISILAATAAVAARGRVIETRVENAAAREVSALRTALDITAWRIALQGRVGLNALPQRIPVGDHLVEVSLAPTHGRVDINMADETAWMRVFAAAGAPDAIARRLTDEILDWRDADIAVRPFGAERANYAGLRGKEIGDRAFASVEELILVRSMTPGRLACIQPYLTAFGGTGPVQGAPPGDFQAPQRADGVRAALRARLISDEARGGRALDGLVQFGVGETRPYSWVRFGGDDGAAPACDPSVF
jgi:general secretion pathway protein K